MDSSKVDVNRYLATSILKCEPDIFHIFVFSAYCLSIIYLILATSLQSA